MSDLIMIRPYCRESVKTKRLNSILDISLEGYTYDIISTIEEFRELKNNKILFAISLGESGINLELYAIIKAIRLNRNCFEGCVGGIIIDGNSELFTKSVSPLVSASTSAKSTE
jgi:hypothetical protein